MTNPDKWPGFQWRHGKLPPLTIDEFAAINGRLRTAYQLIDEIHVIISGRIPRPMMDKYLKMRWSLNSVGENLNNRIDWLKPSHKRDRK